MTEEGIRVRNTPPFRLKPQPGKNIQGIDLMKQFNFIPEFIFIERIATEKNMFIIRAVLTEEEAVKEKTLENLVEKAPEIKKKIKAAAQEAEKNKE